MIAANGVVRALMLFQATPQGSASARFQRVGAYSHYAWTFARIGTDFAGFTEEIDAALRPTHATRALRQSARAAELALKLGQQLIKLCQVLRAPVVHWLHSWLDARESGGSKALTFEASFVRALRDPRRLSGSPARIGDDDKRKTAKVQNDCTACNDWEVADSYATSVCSPLGAITVGLSPANSHRKALQSAIGIPKPPEACGQPPRNERQSLKAPRLHVRGTYADHEDDRVVAIVAQEAPFANLQTMQRANSTFSADWTAAPSASDSQPFPRPSRERDGQATSATRSIRPFVEELTKRSPFGLLITRADEPAIDDPRVGAITLSTLMLLG